MGLRDQFLQDLSAELGEPLARRMLNMPTPIPLERDDTRIIDVEAESGWRLDIRRRAAPGGWLFDAKLIAPDGSEPYTIYLWPSVDAVLDTFCGWLSDPKRNLGPTATALRAMVEAELHE